jgi:hypothetical protein
MRIHFSLRTLFILAALVAMLSYWIVRPTIVAAQFTMFAKDLDFMTGKDFMKDNAYLLADWNDRNVITYVNASLVPWYLAQILHGERMVALEIEYLAAVDHLKHGIVIYVSATPFGLEQRSM